MRLLIGVGLTLVAVTVGGLLFVYSGLFNVAATKPHTAIVDWALHSAMHRSVEVRARDIEVPEDLVTAARVEQGARAYDQLCAACHLKPGQTDSLIRQGLNPTPPALTTEGHWSAAEQYWIIHHGIRMTGMPAWGETHEEEDLWELTAFLQRLPDLSPDQYAALVTPSGAGRGPRDDGHDHEHADMGGMAGATSEPASGHHSGEDGHHGDSGRADAYPGEEQAASSAGEEDDHYADGHTH